MNKNNQLYRLTVGSMFVIGGLLIVLSLFFLLYRPSEQPSEQEVSSERKISTDLKTADRFPTGPPSRASETEENTSQEANNAPSDQSLSTDKENSTEQLSPIPQSVTQGSPDRAKIVAKIQELEEQSAAIRKQYLGLIDMANELGAYAHWHGQNAATIEDLDAAYDSVPGTDAAAAERAHKKVMEIIDKFNREQQDIVDTINAVKEEADTLISQRNSILVEIKRLKASIGDK